MNERRDHETMEDWIGAMLSGTLSEQEAQRLAERLRDNPTARRNYVEHMMVHGMLQWELASPQARERDVRVRTQSLQAWWKRAGILAGLGASVAAAVLVVVLLLTSLGNQEVVAEIQDIQGAVWSDAKEPLVIGSPLHRQTIRLSAGVVQLRFLHGACVIMQGPAELELISSTSAHLASGRIVARAPAGAHGFTIQAGGMDIVDLGTEFGVLARPESAEVQVFEGSVEAGATGSKPAARRRLIIGEAVLMKAGGTALERTEFSSRGYVREMRHSVAEPDCERGLEAWWPFDEKSGSIARDATGHGHDGLLHGCTFDRDGVEGKIGGALHFDGVVSYVSIPYVGFDLSTMSIQAWIKPDTDQGVDAQVISQRDGFGLAVPSNHFMKYYFWDRDSSMARQFETGQWYHLMATYDGRERVFYVDGVCIGTFTSKPMRSSANDLHVGCMIEESPGQFYHGSIDDLRIYQRVLTQDEVRHLYLRGLEAHQ